MLYDAIDAPNGQFLRQDFVLDQVGGGREGGGGGGGEGGRIEREESSPRIPQKEDQSQGVGGRARHYKIFFLVSFFSKLISWMSSNRKEKSVKRSFI